MTRILIVRTDGIGDVLLSMPAAGAINRYYANAKIWLLTRHYTKEIGENYPDIEDVLTIDHPDGSALGFWNLVKMLRRSEFDIAILMHPQFYLAAALAAAGIRMRIGTGYRWYSFLFTHKVYEHRKNIEKHEVEYNLSLLIPLGIKADSGELVFNVPPIAAQKVRELLVQMNVSPDKPLMVLHPGSGGSAMDWPLGKFQRLAEKLVESFGAAVVVTGSKGETELLRQFQEGCRSPVAVFPGILSITELAALLQMSTVIITNSTGPLHLGVAVGAQVIGLYPPIKLCSPVRWGPYKRKDSVIQPPCQEFHDRSEAFKVLPGCMDLVTVEQVMEMVSRKMKAGVELE